ncbi:hypothetical protein T484DRAFT_1989199, partial [Baffinella frigidus]
LVYGLWYMVSGIWYLVYGIWYLVSGIWYLVSGIWYLVSGIWYLVSGIWYMIFYVGICVIGLQTASREPQRPGSNVMSFFPKIAMGCICKVPHDVSMHAPRRKKDALLRRSGITVPCRMTTLPRLRNLALCRRSGGVPTSEVTR